MDLPVFPLFVPGDRPERFAKAALSGADAIILDLEDAVAIDRKDVARRAVAMHGVTSVPVFVRINPSSTDFSRADLDALRPAAFDGLMLAKAESARDVMQVHALLGRPAPVIALVETAAAFGNLLSLLQADGVVGVALGSLDLALDLRCEPSWEALSWCRGHLVHACRMAGLPAPIDGVCTVLDDAALITADARHAATLGFGGKLAIHPRQIAPIGEAFCPDATTLAWARQVIAQADQGAAIQVGGAMVDRPVVERARTIVARAALTDA